MESNKEYIKIVTTNVDDLMLLDWVDDINPHKCIYVVASEVLANVLTTNIEQDVYTLLSIIPRSTALHHMSMKNEVAFASVYNTQLESHICLSSIAAILKQAIMEKKDIIFVTGASEAVVDFFKYFRQYLDLKFDISMEETATLREMLGMEDWQIEKLKKRKEFKPYKGLHMRNWSMVTDHINQVIRSSQNVQTNLDMAVYSTLNAHRIREMDKEIEKRKQKEANERNKKLKRMSAREVYGWNLKTFR